MTYWGGLLPSDLLRPLDRCLFFANSGNYDNHWKRTLEDAILVFSDQQLITGIGILVAGFIQLRQDLSVYHWNILRSLAYLSSTVHLMTISLLGNKLEANKYMKSLRLFGMVLLLGLLASAMVPTTNNAFVLAIGRQESRDNLERRGTPAHCFWGNGQALALDRRDQSLNFDSIISYVALFGSFVWKLSQLFSKSRGKSRRWLRVFPDLLLERAARRALSGSWRVTYKFTKFCYIIFMVYAEVLESFMFTMLVLLFTLSWGTLTLLVPRLMAPTEVSEAEQDMQFGQLLPLLLLLQPLLTIFEHFTGESLDLIAQCSCPTNHT